MDHTVEITVGCASQPVDALSAAVPPSPLESSSALETLWRRFSRNYRAGARRTAAMFSDSPMAAQ